MSSYSGNPSTTPKDALRFLIGDTDSSAFNFSDEELVYLLRTQANVFMAAAICCEKLTTIINSGGLTSKSVGSLSESYSSQGTAQFYTDQAKRFRMIGATHQVPTIEDISQKFSFRQFDGTGGRGPRVRDDTFPPPKDEEQTF